MKKTKLLNSYLSAAVANMGHKQMLVLGDAGLPVPKGVEKIDLAVTEGVPELLTVLDAVLSELCVEKIILAEELRQKNPEMEREICRRFAGTELEYVPHEQFKKMTEKAEVVVRTGETRAYSNVILVSGVTF